jgi:hypothetical protein
MNKLFRGYGADHSRRSFLKGTGALGLTLTAGAGPAHGQSAPVVVINESGTVSSNATSGAAKWISPSAIVASSLETGRIGYIVAWGGNEYGYAYTYALSSAPAGVTIDADTGILSIGSRLAPGAYSFSVRVTNREVVSNVASFTFTLHVLQGITSGTPTSSQILHKTYDPGSGTWGRPSGNNWTNVFNAMQTAILADQVRCNAVHDESLRVTIPLQRGRTYQYTNNKWLNGIQYFQVYATGSGALPIMQNVRSDHGGSDPYDDGPWNIGYPGSMAHQEGLKARMARIATVAAGSTTVTLLVAGDATKIKPNRWHVVIGSCIQLDGYPPNEYYIDYVKVTNVGGTTVTIDRPLKYGYDQTWWEDPNNDQILGVARLVPFDTGGTGGYIPADPRIFIRVGFTNINFLGNPNFPGGPNAVLAQICYVQGAIDFTCDGCVVGTAEPSMCKHVYFKTVTSNSAYWEPDKQTETLTLDGGSTADVQVNGATGMQYLLYRNHAVGAIQVSPRQLRAINSSFINLPLGQAAAGGALQYWDFGMAGACQFTASSGITWMWPFNPVNDDTSLVIGTNATWNGNQLRIPRSYANFERWATWSTVGSILSLVAGGPFTTNWGYVSRCTSPGDGTALWLNVVWVNGVKPTSGRLWLQRRRRLYFASGNTLNGGCTWASPKFAKETATSHETGWNFPSGYPASLSG